MLARSSGAATEGDGQHFAIFDGVGWKEQM